jgi:ribosomal protein S18 acetylase RimI-like enzyme
MEPTERPKATLIFPEQYGEAAATLGRAFVDDPGMRAVLLDVTDLSERARRIGQLFSVVMEIQRRHGQPVLGVIDGDRVAAAAVIEGIVQPSLRDTVLSGLRLAPRAIGAVGIGGMIRAMTLADTLYRNRPAEPHIYLNLLGVDPAHQRRHFGIALLDHLRDLARQRSVLAGVYLETATEANVAYYTRAGYEVIGEVFPIGVRMWRMLQRRR